MWCEYKDTGDPAAENRRPGLPEGTTHAGDGEVRGFEGAPASEAISSSPRARVFKRRRRPGLGTGSQGSGHHCRLPRSSFGR